jgi:hypothetical protein
LKENATVARRAKRKTAKRSAGVREASLILGVSRDHLARGLRGDRPISRSLLQRYHALEALKSEHANPKKQTV